MPVLMEDAASGKLGRNRAQAQLSALRFFARERARAVAMSLCGYAGPWNWC
jgi:hypothetical protein